MALSRDGVARFAEVAASHVGDDAVPGLVALVAQGDDVHVEALGSLTTGGAAVKRDSLFRIASTTKPVTAVATLALAREGLLDLDEPVDRLVPELAAPRVLRRPDGPLDETVPALRPITARQLLTFTFGFGMSLDMFAAAEPWPVVAAVADAGLSTLGPPQPDAFVDPDTWIARFGRIPLLAQPGDRWLYNTGSHVLTVLCARAADETFEDVLRTRVFEPLGMRDTGFHATDVARLVRDGAPVLTRDLAREMRRDQLPARQRDGAAAFLGGRGWGLGTSVVLDGPWAGAIGWDGGLGSSILVHPGRDLACIVLTQRLFDSPQPPAVHADLQAAALAAAG